MRLLPSASLAMVAAGLMLAPAEARVRPQRDSSNVLAAARAALGGDALLNSIRTLRANGSFILTTRFSTRRTTELNLALPDKYVVVSRRYVDSGAQSFEITERYGFNGDEPIMSAQAPGLYTGRTTPEPEHTQAVTSRLLQRQKQRLLHMMLPLFASSPAAVPVQFTSKGRTDAGNGTVDVIEVTTVEGSTLDLYIDASTHLPLKLAWLDQPIGAWPGPAVAPIKWETVFSDYKTEGGLTWPRRFITSAGGIRTTELRIRKYAVNVPIKPQTFDQKK